MEDKIKKSLSENNYTKLTDPFAVIDALRGDITGEYEKDLEYLHAGHKHCSEELYNQAYQMDQQP